MVRGWKIFQHGRSISGFFLFLLLSSFTVLLAQPVPPSFQLCNWEERMGMFPCQDCHQDIPLEREPEGRELEEHTHISLQHGSLQCLTCHNPDNRDFLRTVDHQRVPFSHMEKICSYCHAAEYRDWRKGIHGKLLGFWKGAQRGLRCAECHKVHQPGPIILKPEEPPDRPLKPSVWFTALPWM